MVAAQMGLLWTCVPAGGGAGGVSAQGAARWQHDAPPPPRHTHTPARRAPAVLAPQSSCACAARLACLGSWAAATAGGIAAAAPPHESRRNPARGRARREVEVIWQRHTCRCSVRARAPAPRTRPRLTSSSGSVASDAVTVQSRYSWMVAARGCSAFLVPGRGGGACPLSNALNRKGTSARAFWRPVVGSGWL